MRRCWRAVPPIGDRGMRAYRIDSFGSVDGVVLRSRDDPRPGTREILLRVHATSLNYRDLMVLKGGGRGPTKVGVTPLSDGAGEVAAVGEGVTRVKIGDPSCRGAGRRAVVCLASGSRRQSLPVAPTSSRPRLPARP